jgi:hypothetical protein
MNDLNLLSAQLAKAQSAVDNALHSAEKAEQGDCFHDGFRLVFGRHAKAARTRLVKRQRERDRLARRLADLKAQVA